MEEGLVAKGQHRGMFCGDIIRRVLSSDCGGSYTNLYMC